MKPKSRCCFSSSLAITGKIIWSGGQSQDSIPSTNCSILDINEMTNISSFLAESSSDFETVSTGR